MDTLITMGEMLADALVSVLFQGVKGQGSSVSELFWTELTGKFRLT